MVSQRNIKNYINGEFSDPSSGAYLDNFNPSTGEVYSKIPKSGNQDAEQAIEAANRAFPSWSSLTPHQRSDWLMKVSDGINERLEEFAIAESKDNGKPQWLAREVDIPRARDNFSFFATAIRHEQSESHRTKEGVWNLTLRKPIGVAGCISPWNLPLYLFSWKIAPALASGNTVVAKPSEVTPMTAYLLSEVLDEVGFPKGVLNVVHGLGGEVGNAIISHPDVPVVSFTGGTKTGAHIASIAAPMFKKLSLELGGKNPNIIYDDCNFEKMLKTTLRSSFSNQGQICLCGSRIYVQRGIYDRFKKEFIREVEAMKVGRPDQADSKLGAIVSEAHYNKVLEYIELAKEEGGSVIAGGVPVNLDGEHANGWYIRPTVIEGLDIHCRTNQEEIFGPVVTIQPFDTEEEVIGMANATPYGLAATIWTENLNRATRTAEAVRSGIIWVNCWLLRDLRTPFGGMKQSGVGREGGWEALRFFTEPKNVCIQFDEYRRHI